MRLSFVCPLFVALVAPASAGEPVFAGPSGWSANAGNATATDPVHAVLQWHLPGDNSASVTYLRTTTSYDDALTAIHTNFTTNKIKPSVDKDVPCGAKTAHMIEFSTGPDGHKVIIARMLVPVSDGVVAITYARASDDNVDPAVQQAETAYCAAGGS
jgi:hypothetical protein